MLRPTRPGKPAPRPEPPKKPVSIAPALVRFRCGHPADLTQLDCGECRAKHYAAKQARSQAKRDAKKDAAAFRFPAGTRTEEAWDGTFWFGRLYVPGIVPWDVFSTEGITGKEKLGRRFRELYEQWLKTQESDRG